MPPSRVTFEEALALGKSRSDCSSESISALVQMLDACQELPGDVAELGSYKCGATIALAALVPEKTVYAFDLFWGLPYGDGQQSFTNFADTDFEEIKRAVQPFPNIVLIRGLHEDTVPAFIQSRPQAQFSFIFMDSDFHASHAVALKNFWPALVPGGLVVFHDWAFEGVQRAIFETVPSISILESGTVTGASNMGFLQKEG